MKLARAALDRYLVQRRLPATPAKWDPDTPLVRALADDGAINPARLWVVMKRFFVTVANQITQDNSIFAEKLRRPSLTGCVIPMPYASCTVAPS